MDQASAARHLRKCFGRFPTGVTVVTCLTPEGVRGATMNSFTSVSLDPPLVLISVARTAKTLDSIVGQPFSINVLARHQMDVALHFAGRTQPNLEVAWECGGDDSVPTLRDAIAIFACRPWRSYDAGDHVIVIGEVTSSVLREGEPLAFIDGRFASMGLSMMDGPLVYDLEGPPVPAWTGAAHRVHRLIELS